jgi:hypothetical protein
MFIDASEFFFKDSSEFREEGVEKPHHKDY